MEIMENQKSSFERAQKRVKDIKAWYSHLSVYLTINGVYLLFYFGLFDRGAVSGYIPWWSPVSMLVGWGIGLMIHYIMVHKGNFINRSYKSWEERKIKEYLDREEAQRADLNKWE